MNKNKLFFLKKLIIRIYIYCIQWAYLLPSIGKNISVPESNIIDQKTIPYNAKKISAIIAPVYNNKKGICTIISDDGIFSSARIIKKYSEIFDIPITVAGVVKNIELHRRFWKKAIIAKNFECVNHSYNHIRMEEGTVISRNLRRLKHEIADAKMYFDKLNGEKSIVFVCPENQMCETGYKIIEQKGIYAVARGTRGFNSLNPDSGYEDGEWMNLRRMGIMDKMDGNPKMVREEWVNTAIKEKKWLIEMWHNIAVEDDGGYQTILCDEAEEHLAYIKSKDNELWCATFTDATKYILEKQNAKLEVFFDDRYIYLRVQIRNLNETIFNHPLSVVIGRDSLENACGIYSEKTPESFWVNIIPGRVEKISIDELINANQIMCNVNS